MNTNVDDMSVFEMSRWFALIDAIDIIDQKCEERDEDFDELKIQPSALQNYIEKTSDIFARKIEDDKKQKLSIELHINNINLKLKKEYA